MLRSETGVDAVELFDRASLAQFEASEDMTRLVPDIQGEGVARPRAPAMAHHRSQQQRTLAAAAIATHTPALVLVQGAAPWQRAC